MLPSRYSPGPLTCYWRLLWIGSAHVTGLSAQVSYIRAVRRVSNHVTWKNRSIQGWVFPDSPHNSVTQRMCTSFFLQSNRCGEAEWKPLKTHQSPSLLVTWQPQGLQDRHVTWRRGRQRLGCPHGPVCKSHRITCETLYYLRSSQRPAQFQGEERQCHLLIRVKGVQNSGRAAESFRVLLKPFL